MLLAGATWTPTGAQPPADGSLYATHSGVLEIGGVALKCYRLNDGSAVFDADDLARFFGFESVDALRADVARLGFEMKEPESFAVDNER